MRIAFFLRRILLSLALLFVARESAAQSGDHVAVVNMSMLILPGTSDYLEQSIHTAHEAGAKMLIVVLDTPGGMLTTSQQMIQMIFNAPLPVAIYVSPAGASATSAGVFITLAAHVASMAPGTSIGAAHPVTGEGKDIEGDMRKKAENMAVAMVKSIAEERGRNVQWVEKAIVESSSLTEREAVKSGVVDFVANDIDDLLKQSAGREIVVAGQKVRLEDYSGLPRRYLEISVKQRVVNVLANPTIAALLWLGATTGLSLELYNPGAILPGVVGIICLLLALAVSQVIPISQSGILLLITGVLLIGAELFVPSGLLGLGGVIAIVLGAIYLVDTGIAPDLAVDLYFVVPLAALLGIIMLAVVIAVARTSRRRFTTGHEGLIGAGGHVIAPISGSDGGKVFVNGEIWDAVASGNDSLSKDDPVQVVAVKQGMLLEVRKKS